MNLSQFPSLLAIDSSKSGWLAPHFLDRAIRALVIGVERGEIRNVDFNEAKETLNRAVDRAIDNVSDAFNIIRRGEPENELLDEISWKFMVSSVHDLKAAKKRADAYRAKGVDHRGAVILFNAVDELFPLVALFDAAKPLIVKRQPLTDAQRLERAQKLNPDKVIRTCGYCLRHIAVGPDGKMVHHGYERPGDGHQTASCRGIYHGPWERTKTGGERLRADLMERLAVVEKALRDLPNAKRLTRQERRRGVNETVTYLADEPQFRVIQHALIASYGYEKRTLIATISDVDRRLASWEQIEQA